MTSEEANILAMPAVKRLLRQAAERTLDGDARATALAAVVAIPEPEMAGGAKIRYVVNPATGSTPSAEEEAMLALNTCGAEGGANFQRIKAKLQGAQWAQALQTIAGFLFLAKSVYELTINVTLRDAFAAAIVRDPRIARLTLHIPSSTLFQSEDWPLRIGVDVVFLETPPDNAGSQ